MKILPDLWFLLGIAVYITIIFYPERGLQIADGTTCLIIGVLVDYIYVMKK